MSVVDGIILYAKVIFVGGILYAWLLHKKNKQSGANGSIQTTEKIKTSPEIIHPINPSEATFNLAPYSVDIPPLPATEDGWLSIDRDYDVLQSYANELDNHRIRLDSAANAAITRFEKDYSTLNNHQLQIYRRIYQTKNILDRFTELKQRSISVNDIPDGFKVKLPPKPSYLRPEEIQKKYTIPINAISTTANRLIMANGIRSSKNLLVLVGAFAAMAIKGKSNVSQLKRTLEDARGNISSYRISLKTTVGTLGEAHKELVNVSGKLKKSENDIIEVIGKVGAIDPQITRFDQVAPDIRTNLSTLYFLTLEAEGHSKNSL